MRLQRFEPKRGRIEIVPMIDTIFFLLVFFMIASLSMTKMQGMPVNLPKADSAKGRPAAKTVLTLTAQGNYYLDKQPVLFEQVYSLLKERVTENPRLVVVINCDKSQSWQKGIQLADEAKRAGAEKLTIATERKAG